MGNSGRTCLYKAVTMDFAPVLVESFRADAFVITLVKELLSD